MALKREAELKRAEKESGKIMRDILWGVPNGRKFPDEVLFGDIILIFPKVEQPDLADFWSSIYRVQVESRSGQVRLPDYDSKLLLKDANHKSSNLRSGTPC